MRSTAHIRQVAKAINETGPGQARADWYKRPPEPSYSELDEVAISMPARWCTVSLRSSGRS